MSVCVVHHDAVLVVSVRGNDSAMLERLAVALEDVVRHRQSVIIDLSELTLAPRSRIVPFVEQLAALAERSPTAFVVVADRLSARKVLNRLMRGSKAATAPSVSAAMRELQQGAPRTAIPTQAQVADAQGLATPTRRGAARA